MEKYTPTEKLYELFINCDQNISTDTRKISSGSLFFALKGANFNANEFASEALNQGCKYAIIDDAKYFVNEQTILVQNVLQSLQELAKIHRQKLKIPIIGITGSNAKTTHKELIHAVLSKKYKTYATKGNLNNHIGVPLSILEINTNYEIAIIEMGANHQGEIAELSSISDPDYGIITNIGKAHLEGFGGVEGIKKGKSELYKHILAKNGKIFINADDKVLLELGKNLEQIKYGTNLSFFVHGELNKDNDQVSFKWNTTDKPIQNQPLIKTHMFGQYNFINMLCAVCVGNYFGVCEADINSALENYIPEMNRSQIKQTNSNTLILDAYNANPTSMKIAIENFQNSKNSFDKMVILGDMFELGKYAEMEHLQIINQLQSTNITNIYLVGNEFYKQKSNFHEINFYPSTQELAEDLKRKKITRKTILIKGSRSMKLEQVVEFL